MDIRDKIIVKQREIIELYTKYLSDFTKHFGIPNFWEKEFDGKLHEIASLEKEQQEQKLQTAEEILNQYPTFYYDTKSKADVLVYIKADILRAMEEYASQFQKPAEITDEEIEKWAERKSTSEFQDIFNTNKRLQIDFVKKEHLIKGAKAMRDNEIG